MWICWVNFGKSDLHVVYNAMQEKGMLGFSIWLKINNEQHIKLIYWYSCYLVLWKLSNLRRYTYFFLHMYMCTILTGLASSGYVQINLPLEPSKTYFSTVRGVTNGGNVLETSSDGFTVDQTPPTIHIDRWPSRPVIDQAQSNSNKL